MRLGHLYFLARTISSQGDVSMRLRQLPVIIATALARGPHRVARQKPARTASGARHRRHERDDVNAFLIQVLPAQRQVPTYRRA
jgi:hypothetical protein